MPHENACPFLQRICLFIFTVQNQSGKIPVAVPGAILCIRDCIEKAAWNFSHLQVFTDAGRTTLVMIGRMQWASKVFAGTKAA